MWFHVFYIPPKPGGLTLDLLHPKEDGLLGIFKKPSGAINNTPKHSGKWILVIPIGESYGYNWYITLPFKPKKPLPPPTAKSKPATTCISRGFRSCCFVVATRIVPAPKKNEEKPNDKIGVPQWCIQITQQKGGWYLFESQVLLNCLDRLLKVSANFK